MKLRNKKTGKIYTALCMRFNESIADLEKTEWKTLKEFCEDWEDVKEPIIKDDKIRKIVREWAEYNETESMYAYNLVYDHGGVCIEHALVRFYDPRLRTNIDVWFKKFEAPAFENEREYTITELCGVEEKSRLAIESSIKNLDCYDL